MFNTTANIAVVLSALCFIAALLLITADNAQARLSGRLRDRDWAARQTKKSQPRGGSA